MLAIRNSETAQPRPSKNEQLRLVAEEAAEIRRLHAEQAISSEQAAERLTALKRRYSSLFDAILAL